MSASLTLSGTKLASAQTSYAEQISMFARCMVAGDAEELKDLIEGQDAYARLMAFIDGTVDKRIDFLKFALAWVAPVFDDFDGLAETYCFEAPHLAIGKKVDDPDAMLEWMQESIRMTPRQQDYVACQRAKHAVDAAAAANRLEYVRYQEIVSLNQEFANALRPGSLAARKLKIHANPIQVWVTMQTREFLANDSALPGDIVFFAFRGIDSAELSSSAREMLTDLANRGPVTFDQWTKEIEAANTHELANFIRDLAMLGLVALA